MSLVPLPIVVPARGYTSTRYMNYYPDSRYYYHRYPYHRYYNRYYGGYPGNVYRYNGYYGNSVCVPQGNSSV